MRNLANSVKAVHGNLNGLTICRFLEVGWTEGTEWYSDQRFATADGDPVNAAPAVTDWGKTSLQAEAGRIGGFQTASFSIADDGLTLANRLRTTPSMKISVSFWVWIPGTPWADRIRVFRGVVSSDSYKRDRYEVTLTCKPLQDVKNETFGSQLTADVWPEIVCEECDGKWIPIVFGRPCYRVPACSVDRPGYGLLAKPLGPCDTIAEITSSASRNGFPFGTPIKLVVSNPVNNDFDILTGVFPDANSVQFYIQDRQSIVMAGKTYGEYSEGGVSYVTLNLTDARAGLDVSAGFRGFPMFFPQKFGCAARYVSDWFTGDGPTSGTVAAYRVALGEDFQGGGGDSYFIINRQVTIWPAGAMVAQLGSWTYIVNSLPSEEVERVEARGRGNSNAGVSQQVFQTIRDTFYTVNLDDRQFNARLGRGADDPGVTTVTLTQSPSSNGAESDIIFVTLKGTAYRPGSSTPAPPQTDYEAGRAIWKPTDVLLEILSNPWLGNIPVADINVASFNAARPFIQTVFAFCIDSEKKLMDTISDLAQQAGGVVFWDDRVTFQRINSRPSEASKQHTIRDGQVRKGSVSWEDPDISQVPTRLVGAMRPTCVDEVGYIVRKSNAAIAALGKRELSVNLWGYQAASSGAEALRWWLDLLLGKGRRFTFTTFFNGIAIQPGDTIKLYGQNIGGSGATQTPINGSLIRVVSVEYSPGDCDGNKVEEIVVKADSYPWVYDIVPGIPQRDCATWKRLDPTDQVTTDGGPGTGGISTQGERETTTQATTTDPNSTEEDDDRNYQINYSIFGVTGGRGQVTGPVCSIINYSATAYPVSNLWEHNTFLSGTFGIRIQKGPGPAGQWNVHIAYYNNPPGSGVCVASSAPHTGDINAGIVISMSGGGTVTIIKGSAP